MTETAQQLKKRIIEHHRTPAGKPREWVVATEVRNAASFDANRSADALAFNFWTSRGLAVHGYEVKVSRSDWLRELKDPSKAEAFARYCDRWFVVAPEGVVQPEELPEGWGLFLPNRGQRLRLAVPAAKREPEAIGRSFMHAILKRVVDQGPDRDLEEALLDHRRRWASEEQRNRERLQREHDALQAVLRAFNAGYSDAGGKKYRPLSAFSTYGGTSEEQASRLGAALAAWEASDVEALRAQATTFAEVVRRAAGAILAHVDGMVPEQAVNTD